MVSTSLLSVGFGQDTLPAQFSYWLQYLWETFSEKLEVTVQI